MPNEKNIDPTYGEKTIRQDPSATDEESVVSLLERAKKGSTEAYQLLRFRYRPLLDASVGRFVTDGMTLQERQDLKEEAERIFLTAVSTYDTEQDAVDFGLYAKICLRNGLVSEMRSLYSRRRLDIVPMEQEILSEEDPTRHVEEDERFRKLSGMITAHLSPFENSVWWRFVSGADVKEIARQIGKDERSIHNAIYRIRKKLRLLLSNFQN